MDNYKIILSHREVIDQQTKKIELMNQDIEELDGQKQEQQENIEAEKKILEESLQQKYTRKQQLEEKAVNLNYDIDDLEDAKKTLVDTMVERENEITRLKAEKARLDKIRQTQLVELNQKELILEQKRIEN